MYLSVKEVKTLNEYKLLLTFENGEVRLFDMSPYLEKVIFRFSVSKHNLKIG